jgi:hypothetical protein
MKYASGVEIEFQTLLNGMYIFTVSNTTFIM